MPTGDLHRYFMNNGDNSLFKWFHYFDIYERHFERFRGKSPVVVEIGVLGGGSLSMWREYFGAGCTIVGIDINPECKKYVSPGIDIFIGSQDSSELINDVLAKYPIIDVVIDDGSHMMNHMIGSFKLLYGRLAPHGVYVVEDTHTCYWKEFGGGLRAPNSFMEFAKAKFDEINAAHSRGAVPISDFTRSTDSITCYDSIVVFERRPQGQRQARITRAMDPVNGADPLPDI